MIRGTSLLCTIHIPLISIVPPTKKIISSYTNVEAVIFNFITSTLKSLAIRAI